MNSGQVDRSCVFENKELAGKSSEAFREGVKIARVTAGDVLEPGSFALY